MGVTVSNSTSTARDIATITARDIAAMWKEMAPVRFRYSPYVSAWDIYLLEDPDDGGRWLIFGETVGNYLRWRDAWLGAGGL